jgi:hypothetical protein
MPRSQQEEQAAPEALGAGQLLAARRTVGEEQAARKAARFRRAQTQR